VRAVSHCAMEVLRKVTDPDEVEAVDSQAFQAVLDRPQRTVLRAIVDDAVRTTPELQDAILLAEVAASRLDLVQDQPADLAAEQVFATLVFGECLAEADL